MHIVDIPISDGKVASIRTSAQNAVIDFTDWQDRKWRIEFTDILSVENLNIEKEELDRLEILACDGYIDHVRTLVDEPTVNVQLFMFFTPWKESARLRIVAGDCMVEPVDE